MTTWSQTGTSCHCDAQIPCLARAARSRFTSIRLAAAYAAAFLATGLFAAPTAAEFGTIINLSGRQRMLSQKMTKELLLAALNIDQSINLQNAMKTADIFETTLKGLRAGSKELGLPPTEDPAIIGQLDKVSALWNEYHQLVHDISVSGTVTPEQVKRLAAVNLPLLDEMNRCVTLYEKQANGGSLASHPALTVAINLAGKQRMLSQKMTKEFCLLALGYEPAATRLQLSETTALFARTLAGLRAGDKGLELSASINTPEIASQLETVNWQWKTLEPYMRAAIEGAPEALTPATIREAASRNVFLLKDMNKVVESYEALAR